MATTAATKQEELFRSVLGADYSSVVRAVLERQLTGEKDLNKVAKGLLELFDTTKTDVYALLGVSRSRVSRRSHMDLEVLDRAGAAVRLYARVAAMVGEKAAADWFQEPNPHLGGKRPFDLLRTNLGQQELASMITALEDGAYL